MKQEGFEVEVEKDPISDPINKTTEEDSGMSLSESISPRTR